MLKVTGHTAAMSISDGRALAAGGDQQMRPWRAVVPLVGAAVACIATLALVTLSAAPPPSAHPLASHPRLQSHPAASLPISLVPTASSSIGASDRSFWPVRHGASLMARGGGIRNTFTAAGARLRVAQGTLGLSLAAVGRGRRVERIAPVAPQVAASQVLYRHGSVTEFYRNGPYGLEQGFTLSHRPNAGTGLLVLTLSLGGSLVPKKVGSQALFRTARGATALRYGQLEALDATGHRLPAHIQIRNRTLQLRIDDTNARYPVRIDPFIQQGEKLTAKSGEEIGAGHFGESVALSADGQTALIGGAYDNKDVGAAWVFHHEGSTWTQQGAKLVAKSPEEIGEGFFGVSVALSSDGNTALIGGYGDNLGAGAAWVFTRSGSTWTQQGEKLVAKSPEEIGAGHFGTSVALSPEGGNTALIGAPFDNTKVGAAWVFTRASEKWTQQGAKLVAKSPEEIGEGEFGNSVALDSEKGNIALIGGPFDNAHAGAAWVFTRASEAWTQQGAKLVAKEEIGKGLFGESVALSAEKASTPTALIGGPNDGLELQGAAWAFTSSGSTWTQQGAKLVAKSPEAVEGSFGVSVALSSTGNTALIGGYGANLGAGAAWVFTRSSSIWTQRGDKLTGSGESGPGSFGESVALSSTGETALIGGDGDKENIGAAWVFANQAAPPAVVTEPASAMTQTSATLNATVNPHGQTVSDCHFEYGPTETYGTSVPCTPSPGSGEFSVAVSASVTGLTANTTYHFRISATNPTGTSKGSDQTVPAPPTVVTEPASSLRQTSATLNATVNPNTGEVSECKLEYGLTETYGSSVPCTPSPGSGTLPVAVSASLTGLPTNTTYHFRISATNLRGTSKGLDHTFKTLPPNPATVETGTASSVTYRSATLNATVNPNAGEVSECKFEYGTTEAYGKSVPCTPSSPGSGTLPVAVSASIRGLAGSTTYHFRISATNPGGTSKGSDHTFTTLPEPPLHWYQNGLQLPEGNQFPIISWGTLTLSNATLGATECETVAGGDVENPLGGGIGRQETEAFVPYDCVSETCEAAAGQVELIPEKLPWVGVIEEEPLHVFRVNTSGFVLRLKCAALFTNEEFFATEGKEHKPRVINGSGIGSKPSQVEFDALSGELETKPSVGGGKTSGSLKTMGYGTQAILGIKNP
jgi:hypothetical protein